MKIRFSTLPDINSGRDVIEVVRTSREECDDFERRLWDMHERVPSNVWNCGKTVAMRID